MALELDCALTPAQTKPPAEWPTITVQTLAHATVTQLVARSMGLYQHRNFADVRWEMQASLMLAELERRTQSPVIAPFEREALLDSYRHLHSTLAESVWSD